MSLIVLRHIVYHWVVPVCQCSFAAPVLCLLSFLLYQPILGLLWCPGFTIIHGVWLNYLRILVQQHFSQPILTPVVHMLFVSSCSSNVGWMWQPPHCLSCPNVIQHNHNNRKYFTLIPLLANLASLQIYYVRAVKCTEEHGIAGLHQIMNKISHFLPNLSSQILRFCQIKKS